MFRGGNKFIINFYDEQENRQGNKLGMICNKQIKYQQHCQPCMQLLTMTVLYRSEETHKICSLF